MELLLMMGAICLVEFFVAFGVGYFTQRFFSSIALVTLLNIAVCMPNLFYALIFGMPAFVCSVFGAGLGSSIASSRKRKREEMFDESIRQLIAQAGLPSDDPVPKTLDPSQLR